MFICPTVLKLRFYECCHPCFFSIEYIPSWEDIPITPEFLWKKTNWNRLMFGKTLKSLTSEKANPVMCYRRKGDNYVRILDKKEDNEETIYQLQEDGTVKDGIYRSTLDGETELGSVYYARSFTEYDHKKYCLNNLNKLVNRPNINTMKP